MIRILKQTEEVNEEHITVEMKKTEAIAYWQRYMSLRIA